MSTQNHLYRRLVAALLVALVALAPHAAHAQPILRGKAQQAAAGAPASWQPVSSVFVAGKNAFPNNWDQLTAGRINPPVIVVEVAPASALQVSPLVQLPTLPWLNLLTP